ncbi:MAG TPA: pirin family protein [Rubrivivax sp.]|nr:pirin family protein [Rubrivivax sp.]
MSPASRPRWQVRRADDRGQLHLDWLQARFSFSFGDWDDPAWRRFGPLLALNEDEVQPRTGFPMHPHRDLEILMLPLAGAVAHADDQGGQGLVLPGEVQFIRAGRGIRHSQLNPLPDRSDRHLQIWLDPQARGLAPTVQQVPLPQAGSDGWAVFAATAGAPLTVDADVEIALGHALRDQPLLRAPRAGRWGYVHVIEGRWRVSLHSGLVDAGCEASAGLSLSPGDAFVLCDDTLAASWQAESGVGQLLAFDVSADQVRRQARA